MDRKGGHETEEQGRSESAKARMKDRWTVDRKTGKKRSEGNRRGGKDGGGERKQAKKERDDGRQEEKRTGKYIMKTGQEERKGRQDRKKEGKR